MTPKQLIEHYPGGVAEAAAILSVTRQAISKWLKNGHIPALRQLQIRDLTRGELLPSRAALRELGL